MRTIALQYRVFGTSTLIWIASAGSMVWPHFDFKLVPRSA